MIDSHSATLGKGQAVTDFHSILHNLHNISDIIVLLHSLQHSLQSLYIAIQPLALPLQLRNPLLVLIQFVPYRRIIKSHTRPQSQHNKQHRQHQKKPQSTLYHTHTLMYPIIVSQS